MVEGKHHAERAPSCEACKWVVDWNKDGDGSYLARCHRPGHEWIYADTERSGGWLTSRLLGTCGHDARYRDLARQEERRPDSAGGK